MAATGLTPPGLVDTKLLGKPEKYNNDRATWPEFSFSIRSYVGAISSDLLEAMTKAEALPAPIRLVDLNTQHKEYARSLMYILSACA